MSAWWWRLAKSAVRAAATARPRASHHSASPEPPSGSRVVIDSIHVGQIAVANAAAARTVASAVSRRTLSMVSTCPFLRVASGIRNSW